MDKVLKIIQIVVWSIVAVVLIGILVTGVFSGRGFLDMSFFTEDLGLTALVKEEETQIPSGITKINIDCHSSDIIIKTGDDDKIKVVQYAPENTAESELFTLTKSDSSITISQRNNKRVFFFSFGSITNKRYIEVLIPEGYSKELVIKTLSGDIDIQRELDITRLGIDVKSGDVSSNHITAPTVDISTKSGDVELKNVSTDRYSISTVSGDVDTGLVTGEGSIKVTSGDMEIGGLTGGEVSVSTISGDVDISSLTGYGTVKTTSGDIRVSGINITADLSISCQSGNIDVKIADGVSAKIHARTISGKVRSKFDLDFDSNSKKADGSIGDNAENTININSTSGDVSVY